MQIMPGQLYALKPKISIFLANGTPKLAPIGSPARKLQDLLFNYAFEQGIVNKKLSAPIDPNMDLRRFSNWLHLFLFKDKHLQELKDLKTIDVINFLRDAATGKIDWLQSSGEQAAAWFLLFDYGKYVDSLPASEYTPDQAGQDGLFNEAEASYNQLKAIYDLRDSDPKAFSAYPDKMMELLSSSRFAERAGAMYFMLKLATTDPTFAFPPPEAVFIQEGLVGVIRETPKVITDLATKESGAANTGNAIDFYSKKGKKNNTVLYVGVGVAAIAAIGVTVWAIRRK